MGSYTMFDTILHFLYPPEQTTWDQVCNYGQSLWTYGFQTFINLIMIVGLCAFIYLIYIVLTTIQNGSKNNATSEVKSLTVYNNTMNIHIWLTQAEDYLDRQNISSDKKKLEIILDKIPNPGRNIMSTMITEKQIENLNFFYFI